jgi:hypothetical protein
MKKITTLSAVVCALAMLGLANLARADDDKKDSKPCCEATVEAGKKCEHECCKKAAADGKVCEKCHPKKDESKGDKKG